MRSLASAFSASDSKFPFVAQRQGPPSAAGIAHARCFARKSLSDAIEVLRPYAASVGVARDETIFSEGGDAANAYIIVDGVVRQSMTARDGGLTITDFMLGNDPLGVIEDNSYTCAAEAATDVNLLRISKAEVSHLIGESVSSNGLKSYAWELMADAWRFQKAIAEKTPDQRLACFLIRFSQRTNTPIGRPINLPIGDQDIASHLGLSADDVFGSFAALTRRQAIQIDNSGASCTILDAAAMIGLAVEAPCPKPAMS